MRNSPDRGPRPLPLGTFEDGTRWSTKEESLKGPERKGKKA